MKTKHNCRCMLCHSTRELLADYKYATGAIANAICEVCKECTSHIIIDMNPPILPLFIKPGAFVRLRNGEKARIYATDGISSAPIHGAVFSGDAWRIQQWSANLEAVRGWYETQCGDIISAWKDTPDCSVLWPLLPPWIKYLAQDGDKTWNGFSHKPHLGDTVWHCSELGHNYCSIPTEYHPIFQGDWKDSLTERPQ